MNMILKSAVASALGLAATSAFAIGIPNSGTSDVILIVSAYNSGGTDVGNYALDTQYTVGSLFNAPYTSGALQTTQAGLNATITASPTLSAFLASNSGDTIEWTLEGASFTATGGSATASTSNVRTAGLGLAVFTSALGTTTPALVASKNLSNLVGVLNGVNGDIGSGGLTALQTSLETNAASLSLGDPSKNGFFGANDEGATGTPLAFYGFTGNGGTGTIQSYVLGSATLAANGTLTITGNTTTAPVPVPAALWLFGSGLLGLVGVSRRRKAAV